MGASVVGAVAGTAFAATAAGAVASTVVTGALVGAAVGGISAAVSGGNVLKGALVGGVVGGVSGGIGAAVGGTAGGLAGGAARGVSSIGGAMLTSQGADPYEAYGNEFERGLQVQSSIPGPSTTGTTTQQGGGLMNSYGGSMLMKAGLDTLGGMAKGYMAGEAAEDAEDARVKSRETTYANVRPATANITKDEVAKMTTPDQQAMSYRVFQKPLETPAITAQKPQGMIA